MRGASGAGGYKISRSLRFNSADSAYLNRTPASATNRRTYTFSTWVKRSQLNSGNAMLATVNGSAFNYFSFGTSTGDFLTFAYFDGSSDVFGVNTSNTSVFRDVSAWYHIVLYVDTTQATASNRVKFYVNNVEQTGLGGTYPTLNYDTQINSIISTIIGGGTGSNTAYLSDQYMTEINFIDGQALTPSSFGETNAQTGVWQPKAYSGSYGTNGFYLNFSDNSNTTAATLGKDYSGNGNNWTPNNFSVTAGAGNDSLVDSPTSYGTDTGVGGTVRGNYATFNPLSTTRTIINGNLYTEVTGGGGSNVPISSTMALPTTGKWYWEITAGGAAGGGNGGWDWGIVSSSTPNFRLANLIIVGTTGCHGINGNSGILVSNGTSVTTYISGGITGGDIAQAAYDADSGKLWLGKNNTWGNNGGVGNPAAGTNAGITGLSGEFIPMFEYASDSGLVSATLNMGQRPFAYTAPSGFKALCTQNLPTPTIGATAATQANKYFGTATYTGNGTSQSLALGFQPDFTWIKARSINGYSNLLTNALTGGSNYLVSNNAGDESGGQSLVTSWTSTGVNLGSWIASNESGQTFVAWNWRASNASAATNTSGSITSSVIASPTSGFSIVTYTGTGGNATVGHGLGVAPQLIFVKGRNTSTADWFVYTSTQAATKYLSLNLTAAVGTDTTAWNSTAPTSTVFSVGGAYSTSWSAKTYIAYCFTPIAGYSAMGSYTGNGSADGAFVYTGFRPAFILVKASSGGSSASANWLILDNVRDTYNVTSSKLAPNLSTSENGGNIGDSTQNNYDLLSNGFKARTTNGSSNENGTTYIYMAFASNPFKYSLAR